MVTCPWCGTNYEQFQSNCTKCGGPMAVPRNVEAVPLVEDLPVPPPPPRLVAKNYAWKLMLSDGWSMAAFIFALLGAIFTLVGLGLTLGIVTAFVGIPFLGIGLVFLAGGGVGIYWRYQEANKIVGVIRVGQAAEGQILQVEQNHAVQVNGRSPWVIRYQFALAGQLHAGKVTTLNTPGTALQPGKRACILYLPQSPDQNMIYPHP